MSTLQAAMIQTYDKPPPWSFVEPLLTPPQTDERQLAKAQRVLDFFEDIRAGKNEQRHAEVTFQLTREEYRDLHLRLALNEELRGFVRNKIRYDYDADLCQLVVRMPTGVHELLIAGVEDAIWTQLKAIRSGEGPQAQFAQKVRPARSTEIEFPVDSGPADEKSRYEPDTSFWHDDAKYPGVVVEVAYSQKKGRLDRLAENYLLDSDASVQVVVGLHVEYSQKGSRKAALSVWRTREFPVSNGHELRVIKEIGDEIFSDGQGNPTDQTGLRLSLRDFANQELVKEAMGDYDQELVVPPKQLCEYLIVAETKAQRAGSLSKHHIPPGIKKRKRSATPPEELLQDDVARYTELEARAGERTGESDPDYEETSSTESFAE